MSTYWIECPIYVSMILIFKEFRHCQSSHFPHDICDEFLNQIYLGRLSNKPNPEVVRVCLWSWLCRQLFKNESSSELRVIQSCTTSTNPLPLVGKSIFGRNRRIVRSFIG